MSLLTRVAGACALSVFSAGFLISGVLAQPLRVGVMLPLSGPSAAVGNQTREGVELGLKALNANGGLLGREIDYVVADDESVPAIGLSRVNELLAKDIEVLVGGWNSPVLLAYQPILAKENIFSIATIAKVDQVLTGADKHAFKISPDNKDDARQIAKLVVDKLDAKSVLFMSQSDVYGDTTQKAMEAEILALRPDIKVLGREQFQYQETNFRNLLEKARSLNPDVIVVTNSSQASGMAAMLQQADEIDLPNKIVVMQGGLTDITVGAAGPSANGVYSVGFYFADKPPYSEIPLNKEFVEAYRAAYGVTPDAMAASGYIAVQVWAEAVRRAGTTERVAVSKAMRGQSFPDTIWGEVSVDDRGQLSANYTLFQVTDGERTPLPD
ncbi:ABC transporter substrate-binding protein [Pseudochelatococcus contaminans]|uniref:Branched-chain amino acid transport system substrate-binding protein n=1 Tax=Pseudochelatococcus contaminans TaxID=1538103 RepID=A0A7W6EHR3_9HYPH|nr:ABC transporter substrate-binding protein [Pseudochelatococcus contaminans]MBB3810394.1 branched-chain amino acid transport system substrate-binding protein [Pseudochelatococcus contaminans]